MVSVNERANRATLVRAQSAAPRITFAPLRIEAVSDISIQPELHAEKDHHFAHVYKVEAANPLPVLNLRLTLSWYALGASKNLRFLRWTKRNYRTVSFAYRLGNLVGIISLIIHHSIASYMVPVACVLVVPGLLTSYATLSVDMCRILTKEYEFWFFTIVNILTWAVLSVLYQDFRIAYLVTAALGIQLFVLVDADFRTFVPAIKSCASTIPIVSVYVVLVLLRLVDIPSFHYISVRIGKLDLGLVDVFVNAVLTLLLFLLREVYNKKKLLYRRYANTKIIRCFIFRCALILRPLASHSVALKKTNSDDEPAQRAYGTRVVLKQLGITAQKEMPQLKSGRAANPRQQLTMVSLRLNTIDIHKTLFSGWFEIAATVRAEYITAFYLIGSLGLLGAGCSMLIPSSSKSALRATEVRSWLQLVPGCSFIMTLIFCGVFACGYQRDFVRAMVRNFSFLFPSLQFTLGCICLADAMQWDNQCWAIAAYCLWFHWILLLDATSPPVRKLMRFRRSFALSVVVAVWVGMCSVAAAILLDSPLLHDRQLLHWDIGLRVLKLGTKSILLNRIFTIFVWTMRLMWQIKSMGESKLVLLRGSVDYFCPFETFTGLSRGSSSRSVFPGSRARRDSDGSVILISTDASLDRRCSFQRAIRRMSSLHQLPNYTAVVPMPRELPIRKLHRALSLSVLQTDIATRSSLFSGRHHEPRDDKSFQSRTLKSPTIREISNVIHPGRVDSEAVETSKCRHGSLMTPTSHWEHLVESS